MARSSDRVAALDQGKYRSDVDNQQEGKEGAGEEGGAHATIEKGRGRRG